MFLIESLCLISFIFFASTIIGYIILPDFDDREVPVVLKVGAGFFISVAFFASTWQITTIPIAWVTGMVVCLLYAHGKLGRYAFIIIFKNVKHQFVDVFRFFILVLGASALFFAPNIVSNNYGPFTESGGDVSIYSDVSKLLTDNALTEYGNNGDIKNIPENIREIFRMNLDPDGMYQMRVKRYREFEPEAFSAVHGNGQARRIVAAQVMSAFLYAPYAQYNFLAKENNYAVYFALQAFLYAIILASMWIIFRPYGKAAGYLGLGVGALSHGLISVFYNMYAAQTYSVAFSIFAVAAIPFCRGNFWRFLKFYIPGIAYIWAIYIHFLSIIGPVALGAIFYGILKKKKEPVDDLESRKSSIIRQLAVWAVGLFFFCAIFLLIIGGSGISIGFFKNLIGGVVAGGNNVYMGEQLSFFNWKSLSFLFGILSQQHYSPFAIEYDWLNYVVILGVGLGTLTIFLGLIRIIVVLVKDAGNLPKRELFLYAIFLFTIIPHVYLSRMSLYTQAKGCQNIILYLYCAMLIPLFIQYKISRQQSAFELKLNRGLYFLVVLFCISLIIPRAVYGAKIAFEFDRAGILSQSYFDAAKIINAKDNKPFVLFEPRKSADLYLNDQAFFNAKTVPTRHLVLQQLLMKDGVPYDRQIVTVADLLQGEDIDHIWTVTSRREDVLPALGIFNYVWNAERLVDKTDPALVLAGDSFEQNYGPRKTADSEKETGMFSYVRNGLALLYIPKNKSGKLEIVYEPRDERDFEKIAQEIKKRAGAGEYSLDFEVLQNQKNVVLKADVKASDANRLIQVARFSGECWLNIKIDGKDL